MVEGGQRERMAGLVGQSAREANERHQVRAHGVVRGTANGRAAANGTAAAVSRLSARYVPGSDPESHPPS